jgi:hypothetical protein
MEIIANALPARPIKVTPVQPADTVTGLLLGLFLVALGPLFWWWLGDGLVQDVLAPADLQQARDIRVTEARCKTKTFIFTDCSIKTSARNFEYFFIRTELADTVAVLRSSSKPTYLTTTIGQDNISGRIALLSLFLLLFVGGGLALLWLRHAQKAAEKRFAAMDGQPMDVGLVTLTKFAATGSKAARIDYTWQDGATPGKAFVMWPNATQPIVVDGTPQRLLAVRSKAGGAPMLVDQGFTALALSEAEQKHLYDTVNAYLASTPAT